MVIILPDHGTRYLGKIYNDDWMKDHGYLEVGRFATAKDIIKDRKNGVIISADKNEKMGDAIAKLTIAGISQIPVTDGEHYVGSLTDAKALKQLLADPTLRDRPVYEIMDKPFPFVGLDNTIDVLSSFIAEGNNALMVRDDKNQAHIITQSDLLTAISR